MAKVKQDAGPTPAAGTAEKASEPKKPGRNDLVAAATLNGTATFKFDEPMMTTGEFISYNGGKGMHSYNVIREQDGAKLKSGKTALKYLMHSSGKSLLDVLTEQSKRGRPAKTENATATPPVAGATPATAPAGKPTATPAGQPADPFAFMDQSKPGTPPA